MARPQAVRLRLPVDALLFGTMLALIVIGLLMVVDSSYVKTLDSLRAGHDAYYDLKKQVGGVVVGLFAMVAVMRIGYWRLKEWAVPLAVMGGILLLAVWFPHIGQHENGAARWVKIGIRFQPSEIAKLTLLLYVAAQLARPACKIRHLTEGLGPTLIVAAFYLLAIEREPDLGTAFALFLAVLSQLFLAGARRRHIALILASCGLLAFFVIGMSKHRQESMSAFLDPGKYERGIGYQVYHARLAVGSGGWEGMGIGQGREKSYLPESDTDFIFATMAEELGFFWLLPILGLLIVIGGRGFWIAFNTKDRFGQVLAGGIASLISWQALINIAVATGSIPATGVPLPFMSFGSTSLVSLMVGVGLLLNIAQHPVPPPPVAAKK
ncbi:MAG: Bacterial cell division rane protein [Chthonomonadales bacterium]|nr:Bacterial cell division rane protein [Chthonomonadales bacterium]